MKRNLKLHHCAKRITPNHLEFVMALFARLGCRESYWEKGGRWAMVEQEGSNTIIQFIEADQSPQTTGDFCFQCDEFPCDKTNFDPHLEKRWIQMNRRMKEIGVEAYYEENKALCRYF